MHLSRLLNIVMLLLRVEKCSATTLAARFEVSTRTIYRDIELLALAGIPVFAMRGRNGGIQIAANYKIDNKLLTDEDVRNLLTALASIHGLIATPSLRDTTQKLQAMFATTTDPQLLIEHASWVGSKELNALAGQFDAAIAAHTYVHFTYNDRSGNPTQRRVEPYRLMYRGDTWYLQAYSLERQAFRTFRLSRIQLVVFEAATFEPRAFSAEANFQARVPFVDIQLTADDLVRDSVVERFGRSGIRELQNGRFTVTLHLPDDEYTYRWLLSLGNHFALAGDAEFIAGFKRYLTQFAQQLG